MNLLDLPWFFGLTALLAWCLDAVLRWGPLEGAVTRRTVRLAERLEFVVRQGLEDSPRKAGLLLTLWVAGTVAFVAWGAQGIGFVLGQELGRFSAGVVVLLALFGGRSLSQEASLVERFLLEGRTAEADAVLARHGLGLGSRDVDEIAAGGVRLVSSNLLADVVMPIFWGIVLGPAAAALAFGVQVIADRGRHDDGDPEFWHWAWRIESWLQLPAAWFGLVALQFVAPIGGARRAAVMHGYMLKPERPPRERMTSAFVGGLNLGEAAGGEREGEIPRPSDIQRAVILMWTTSFGVLAAGTLLVTGLLWLL